MKGRNNGAIVGYEPGGGYPKTARYTTRSYPVPCTFRCRVIPTYDLRPPTASVPIDNVLFSKKKKNSNKDGWKCLLAEGRNPLFRTWGRRCRPSSLWQHPSAHRVFGNAMVGCARNGVTLPRGPFMEEKKKLPQAHTHGFLTLVQQQ